MTLAELRADLLTLQTVLNKYTSQEPPNSTGLRITRQIFTDALSDSISALESMVSYLENKPAND